MKRLLLVGIILFVVVHAQAAVEFSGYLESKSGVLFVITDTDTGTISGWLAIGGTFEGHRLRAFDRKRETLILEKEGQTIRLPLKEARVSDGKASALVEKSEIKVVISSDGAIVIADQSVTVAEFETMMRSHAAAGKSVRLYFHEPLDPGPHVGETIRELHRALQRSGLKKWSFKIVDARPVSK